MNSSSPATISLSAFNSSVLFLILIVVATFGFGSWFNLLDASDKIYIYYHFFTYSELNM